MYECREARIGFVVPGGDAAELLDLAEEVFDQMAPLVHLEVTGDCGDPIGFGRDHGGRPPAVQLGAEPVAVEGFVRQQGGEVEIGQKRGDTRAVVSGSRTNRTRLPSASTSATIVKPPRERPMACVLVPPFALVPCWCTRTMVPSTMTYSKSASADKASKMCSNTPLLTHRRNL